MLNKDLRALMDGPIRSQVEKRIKEFRRTRNADELFSELCFCLMTANFNAERAIKIQGAIGDGFATLSEKQLAKRLKQLGHRYPNARARYIVEARKHKKELAIIVKKKGCDAREWLVKNVKGLGYKEASHFLRNVGYCDLAIIDFHIVDVLVKNRLIKEPKKLGKKEYIEIELVLEKIAKESDLTLDELDLYLWYMETGKVLK